MNIEGMTTPEASAYLRKKGWECRDTGDAWKWVLPPCPGQHTIEHAVAVQKGLDKPKKTKRLP